MMVRTIAWGDDLPAWGRLVVVLMVLVFVLVTTLESLRTHRLSSRAMAGVVLSGGLAAALLMLALLRPAMVRAHVSSLGAKVVVLLDRGRHMEISVDGRSRSSRADAAAEGLRRQWPSARMDFIDFGSDEVRELGVTELKKERSFLSEQSDVFAALEAVATAGDEKPTAIVVLSDGNWTRPEPTAPAETYGLQGPLKGAVVHTVDVGGRLLRDSSVLSVHSVGSAVAHQPLVLEVSIYCATELGCTTVPVVVREHLTGSKSEVLARAEASFHGTAETLVNLEITVERAGARIIEVAIEPPAGDEVPENDRRYLALNVVRDRLRLLHVAGRPTYDMRALRQWLKSDSSVDLVSFFILRTDSDDPQVSDDAELALIPFPVDELFTEHLSSFDAIVLEDIDAERYRLSAYLENLARYVEKGGGLILVGGPSAFSGGGYARSALERVLPFGLVDSPHPFDTVDFVPRLTEAGREARMLEPLRLILEDELPVMPGANSVGPARPGAVVLWEHPQRTALPLKTGGAPGAMPVLAVSEVGDGRVVALGVDGIHRLAWGSVGAKTGGRAYGALWDGLLGWVMRDPRFEAVHGELEGECIVGHPSAVRVTFPGPYRGPVGLAVTRLDPGNPVVLTQEFLASGERFRTFELGKLTDGAYSAKVRLSREPAARFDFACERGGRAWADSRAYPERLRRLAAANHGLMVAETQLDELPSPVTSQVTTFRQVVPWAPSWVWALAAAVTLGLHWFLRRTNGLR